MPVIINEVVAEVEPNTAHPAEPHLEDERLPLVASERELVDVLALVEERRERLQVD